MGREKGEAERKERKGKAMMGDGALGMGCEWVLPIGVEVV